MPLRQPHLATRAETKVQRMIAVPPPTWRSVAAMSAPRPRFPRSTFKFQPISTVRSTVPPLHPGRPIPHFARHLSPQPHRAHSHSSRTNRSPYFTYVSFNPIKNTVYIIVRETVGDSSDIFFFHERESERSVLILKYCLEF